jgi:Holliday junction DNA helicase RuvB
MIWFSILVIIAIWRLWAGLRPAPQVVQEEEKDEKTKAQEMILKNSTLDPSKIIPYEGEPTSQKKFIFRPQSLEEYIGQEDCKDMVKLNIEKIKKVQIVHFLLSGAAGHGKTTLAYIIRNMLGGEILEYIGNQIQNPEQVIDIINRINTTKLPYPVLFIDEIHNVPPAICENFYTAMEDFKLLGKQIKPFILIGATTRKDDMVKKVKPFVDRFQVPIILEKYKEQEIVKIIKQYLNQLHPNNHVKAADIEILAKNCKLTPRIALAFVVDLMVSGDVNKVLKCRRIAKDGLTYKDVEILRQLASVKTPMGEEALAQSVGLDRSDYRILYEPYLAEQGYMARTSRGRQIKDKGVQFLQTI